MLWMLFSLFCCWLLLREFLRKRIPKEGYEAPDTSPIDRVYVSILLVLALGSGWIPLHRLWFEHMLSEKASLLAAPNRAHVHCNTVFDTFLDTNSLAAGHANPENGQIVFQHPWCDRLMDYLSHPERASDAEIASLNILTHESMHVRGEYDEARTECQAVQRNYRTARLLGVPDHAARKSAWYYYKHAYKRRAEIGGMSEAYFSADCVPDGPLDEHLPDSTWAMRE